MLPTYRSRQTGSRRAGFTLVELLIVIGIITVLAGLLLTVRSRASEQAASVMCLNNLRQLGAAMTMYAQSNEQAYPFASPLDNLPPGDRPEDWIHWQVSSADQLPDDINRSALAPYVRARGPTYQTLMRCPGDDPATHRFIARGGSAVAYPYSYAMNYLLSSDKVHVLGGARWNNNITPRVTAIARPAEKVLLAEENERTIDDGLWQAGTYTDPVRSRWMVRSNYLSIRHDTRKGEFTTPVDGTLPEKDKRGNVVFVDGHAEFIYRKRAHTAQNLLPSNEGTGLEP